MQDKEHVSSVGRLDRPKLLRWTSGTAERGDKPEGAHISRLRFVFQENKLLAFAGFLDDLIPNCIFFSF